MMIFDMEIKMKICSICGTKFKPFKTTQRVCSMKCSIQHSNNVTKERAIAKKKNELKKRSKQLESEWNLKTLSDWKNDLETVFNKMIRIRDVERGCVSCGVNLIGTKFDAGHFWPKTYGILRFNEWNVHGQCVQCNQHKGSNGLEYRKRIIQRITPEQLKWLDEHRHCEWKPTIPEIKKMIEKCKQKIKQLQNERN